MQLRCVMTIGWYRRDLPMAGNGDIQPADDQYPSPNRDAQENLPRRLPVPWPRSASMPGAPGEPAAGADVLARVRIALLRM